MRSTAYLIILLCALSVASCTDEPSNENHVPARHIPEQQVNEQFVRANQQLLVKENDEIDAYIKTHRLPFTTTASGVRYFVYKPSAQGDSIRDGMQVSMEYTVSLLNGTTCYTSDEDGVKSFIVGQGDVESGIHRGVQFLKKGDKALLIIPSSRAHGLLGDMKKIPPHMPILYNLRVF